MNRREFLQQLSILLASQPLTACCVFSRTDHVKISSSVIVIDSHCHVFNAADLPIAGFVKEVVLGNVKIPGADTFFGLLLQAFTDVTAPGYKAEKRRLKILMNGGDQLKSLQGDWHREDKQRADLFATSVNKFINDIHFRSFNKQLLSSEEREFHNAVLEETGVSIEEKGLVDWFQKLIETSGLIGRYLLWGVKIVRFRYQQVGDIRNTYPQVDLFTPAIIDFDRWLYPYDGLGPNKARVSIPKQMELMKLITKYTGGRFHPYISYDPLRDIETRREGETNGETFEYVKVAIEQQGAIGIKLYPPMGFRAYENTGQNFCDARTQSLGKKLDEALWGVYKYCNERQVPILAHTADSNYNSRCDGYSGRPHPKYWSKVLEAFPDLRINLGHFATHDYPDYSRNDWIKAIRELMLNEKYKHVYADLSHVEKLSSEPYRKKFFEHLANFLKDDDLENTAKLKSRLLYGSDWFMLAKEKISRRYFTHLVKQFDEYFGKETRNQFIGQNAVNFLGLKTGKNRERLEKFYSKQDISKPAWMAKL